MYAPSYGLPQGNTNAPAPFNANQVPQAHPPPPQNQHLMYNQYAQQPPYGSGTPQSAAMMQANGMAQMAGAAAGNVPQPQYQTPYGGNSSGNPYAIPTSGSQQNFMMATPNGPAFTMAPQNMVQPPQRMGSRPPSTSTPTSAAQRMSPFNGAPRTTPPQPQAHGHPPPQQTPQFSPPQTPTQAQSSSQNPNQPSQATPQTPNFPGASSAFPPPLSPGSEIREKERVGLLLEINNILLMEVIRLQALQGEAKKNGPGLDKDKAAAVGRSGKEYMDCMRRLQANLGYLAAIADRAHKPASQIPPHPAIMSAPVLSPVPQKSVEDSSTTSPSSKSDKKEDAKSEENTSSATPEVPNDRDKILQEQYARLQALFPGVDPKKEPPMPQVQPPMAQQMAAANAKARAAQLQQAQAGTSNPQSQQQQQSNSSLQSMNQNQQSASGSWNPQLPTTNMMNATMQAFRQNASQMGSQTPTQNQGPGSNASTPPANQAQGQNQTQAQVQAQMNAMAAAQNQAQQQQQAGGMGNGV